MRAVLPAALAFVVVVRTAHVTAQSEDDRAAAEALFQEARRLSTNGKHTEACPKFSASLKLDPALGTLLNLADCYEKVGKLASAWSRFREAVDEARRRGEQEREKFASERAAALEPQLPKLEIVVPSATEVTGLTVLRDGTPVTRELWGMPMPVDPGEHSVEATAPGKQPAKVVVRLAPGQTEQVQLPPLTSATAAAGDTSASGNHRSKPAGSTQRTLAIVALGVGAVGLGVGTFYGLKASSTWSDAERARDNDLVADAGAEADLSTVAFGVGAAAIATGVVLWVTSPSTEDGSTRGATTGLGLSVRLGESALGLAARGCY